MIEVQTGQKLPVGWRWAKLGEVSEIISGQSPPGDTYRNTPEGLPFFQGKADFGQRHPVPRMWCVSPVKVAKSGDILISVRAPVGPTNVADQGCCIGRGLAAISCRDSVDQEFVLAALRLFENVLAKKGSGSTFQAINRDDLINLTIPLPPLPEQKRIAAILTDQMAAVEKARAAAEARLKAAKELPAADLREVFESEEAQELPKKRLGDVLYLRNEIVHPYDKPEGNAMFVGLEHLQSGTGIRSGSVSVEMENLTGRKPKFYKGDIVYGYLRPYLNKVWIAEFDGLCSVDQYVYSVDAEQADTRYVAWYLRSPLYLQRAPIDTSPGQLPRIRKEEVASVTVELPPIQEQTRIADQVDAKMGINLNIADSIKAELDAINKLPAALLRQALAGEL